MSTQDIIVTIVAGGLGAGFQWGAHYAVSMRPPWTYVHGVGWIGAGVLACMLLDTVPGLWIDLPRLCGIVVLNAAPVFVAYGRDWLARRLTDAERAGHALR